MWGRDAAPEDKFVVYRHYENGEIAEAGIAKWRPNEFTGDKFFRADGTQITDDITYIEIGPWLGPRILRGDLDPTDPTMNNMTWISPGGQHVQLAVFLSPPRETPTQRPPQSGQGSQHTQGGGQRTRNAGASYQTIHLTFYYLPCEGESRFGGSQQLLEAAGKLNGTYRDAQGRYHRWLHDNDFETVSGPTTNSGNAPTADWTLAVPDEWRGKYIAIVRDGQLVARGYGEDSGGAFTPGSSKIDVYAGEGQAAYLHGLEDYHGTCRAYFFGTREAMNTFINGL